MKPFVAMMNLNPLTISQAAAKQMGVIVYWPTVSTMPKEMLLSEL